MTEVFDPKTPKGNAMFRVLAIVSFVTMWTCTAITVNAAQTIANQPTPVSWDQVTFPSSMVFAAMAATATFVWKLRCPCDKTQDDKNEREHEQRIAEAVAKALADHMNKKD